MSAKKSIYRPKNEDEQAENFPLNDDQNASYERGDFRKSIRQTQV